MGETTNQIERHIESKRDDLGSNLQELEQKVKSVTDWRQQFQNNPMTMIGAAFGGGVLLATMLGGGRRRRRSSGPTYAEQHAPATNNTPHAGTDHQAHKALETWDNIKGALIGVAATRFKDFVDEIVPGFHDQFEKTAQQKTTPPPATPAISAQNHGIV